MSLSSSLTWENAQQRSNILNNIRVFFAEKGIVEVETPLLSGGTVTDVHLDAFTTRYNFLQDPNECSVSLYLQTSPEFAMKRLLASGFGSIYQLCKAFRHEEYGRYHNPEFTLLEWYRIGFNHFDLMDEVAAFLVAILNCKEPLKKSYQQAFMEVIELDPLTTNRVQLMAVIEERGKLSDWLKNENDIDTLLQFVFSEFVEPNIGIGEPCFIYNFPASQASLAKISQQDERVAERFECYFRGIELANGFNELTNAESQLRRFQDDNKKRVEKGLKARAIDQNFINALESGLPDCAGVALGVDRLIMLALGKASIDEVLSFPIDRA